MRHLRTALVLLAVSAWAIGPLAAAAGARQLAPAYQSSDPEDGAMVDHPPSTVTATFSEPLDESSDMSVFDECGTEIDAGPATVSLTEMEVALDETPVGTYKVVYTAVGIGGLTGETKGSFDFMVHHGKSCKQAPPPPCTGGGHGHHGDSKCPTKGKGKGKGKGGHHHDDRDRDHGDHDDGMSDHSSDHTPGSDHSPTHTSGSGTHDDDHQMGGGGDHGGGHGDHGGRPDRPDTGGTTQDDDGTGPVAAGPGGAPATADAQAMLAGLGLALVVGVLGGWLLRTASSLTNPA